ncbi:pyruvate dehydrogenase complex dihydrolipoamide acetyltransferase [Pelagibacterium halotolerans]|uniref:Acetyltransferase component of pyruvate dehydrogenase complex n=1 Tax=Pelagibacterium halotolerans (strain DSM 22347 / JCM 15775 / CGMCC 1.7692 / B2) TaxID=1082931 RepID=G4R8Z0_PELHB|nr:pyruvate dehydrogenase complex dihydrolipoamide acetyltransferase [Pelagibacterium halotolerans]AEQ51407.1 dihydrolipoamide acetyltransferase component of pyruvate dehydrogenase complex [Pelagibacterium halotolerans B2]QJR18750.1 pyruvate dehydrogenase complex dihydrolipoamide acetyltransferase [Pelagibacterium halotolerans]SEA12648.1 pyruvate dehydrogenase E2 component (dihydrolipoamide acetyltransferase) [Pelagibacterium halotolerans]
MPINITMPALSPTMEEGTLAKWHVKEGDSVSSGDVIAEIETDKATMEVEAVDEGTIGKILVSEGSENVKVNAVIAVLLEEGESTSDIGDAAPPPKAEAPKAEAEQPKAEQKSKDEPKAPSTSSDAKPTPEPLPAPKADGKRVFASPLARRLARDAGIDLAAVSGSGPKGRVVKADIEKAKKDGVSAKPGAAPAAGAPLPAGMGKNQVLAMYEEGTYDIVPNDGMRKTVAARLTESKQTVPHFYLTLDCNIDALMKAREDLNASATKDKDGKPAYKLSVNDFIMKAWAIALQQVPQANATWAGDSILYHHRSDVAVAVAVPGGLFTPVVKSCDTKGLRQISEEVKDLATRARSKKLAPHEYQGGSSAVSNLGMYGIKHFGAVINPPHGTILAVGAGEERVYAEKGQIKTGSFMTVTLSCDHRSVDGALGAELLAAFKKLIEAPVMMLA